MGIPIVILALFLHLSSLIPLDVLGLVYPLHAKADSCAINGNTSDPVAIRKIARHSVIQIKTTLFDYSYQTPWQAPRIQAALGTGFVIDQQRILTNAHVLSGANTIRVQHSDQLSDYRAKVEYIAHDADLALLSVEDASFFEDTCPLAIGTLPELNSPVDVIGFPIGGDRVSITKGIVSRIDMDIYSHSGIDAHLIVQVDAAINSGNSGGPAVQNGKVIGVAFQALSYGENLGYLIPPPVILRFLEDIKDGTYDGYAEFGISTIPTNNPTLVQVLDSKRLLAKDKTGVLVYDVIPGSSAYGYIQPGDLLVSINGKALSKKGDVRENKEATLQNYVRLVDNIHAGEIIEVEVLRDKSIRKLRFPSKVTDIFNFMRRNSDSKPSYILIEGFVFQPMDARLRSAYRRSWSRKKHPELFFRYDHFFTHKIYNEVSEDVILTRKLQDESNLQVRELKQSVVQNINGVPIQGFAHFAELISKARAAFTSSASLRRSPYLRIGFYHSKVPLIIDLRTLKEVEQRIMRRYSIPQSSFIHADFQN